MKNTRILLSVLVMTLIFGLVACGGEDPTPEPTQTAVSPTSVPPTDTPPTEIPPTATTEPEPTAVSSTVIDFNDEAAGVAIAYPDDWFSGGETGFYIFASNEDLLDAPDPGEEGGLVMLIMVENAEMETTDPAQAIAIFTENFGSDNQLETDGKPTAVSVNGLDGATVPMSFTADNGIDLIGTMSVLIGDSQSAFLVGMTPVETGDEYLPDFETILNSVILSEPVSNKPDEDFTADGNIAYGQSVDGGITSNGRSLWAFDAANGDSIYVTLSPAGDFDTVLDIINQDGKSILPQGAIDDSFGEETADIEIPADGQYFIAISGFADSSGDYQLTLSTNLNAPVSSNLPDGGITQWANSAIASSEFSNDSWAAFQAEGAPDTFNCGDLPTAWAAANSSSVDWIELYYDIPVEVTEINIYQSYNPDQVVAVELIATDGDYVPIFEQAQVAEENCPYILSLAVESNFASNGVRITIDQSLLSDWTEIDAVELIGVPIDGGEINQLPAPPVGDPIDGVLWRIGGISGFEEGDIGHFEGVAYDAERGRVYVADSLDSIIVLDETGEILDRFTTDSLYFSPSAIDLDAAGNIYVANDSFDDDEGRIIVFSPEGDVIHEYGKDGTGDGEFGILSPSALAVTADGTTYALDSNKDSADETIYRIHKFSPDGNLEATIPIDPDYSILSDTPMAADADGFIYLGEWLNGTVIKMDSDGNVVEEISRGDAFYYSGIQGLTIDAAGNIYIAVWDEPAIIKLDQDGNELATFGFEVEDGESAWSAGGFYWPNGIAVSPNGDTLYVTDWSGDYAYLTAVDMSQ